MEYCIIILKKSESVGKTRKKELRAERVTSSLGRSVTRLALTSGLVISLVLEPSWGRSMVPGPVTGFEQGCHCVSSYARLRLPVVKNCFETSLGVQINALV